MCHNILDVENCFPQYKSLATPYPFDKPGSLTKLNSECDRYPDSWSTGSNAQNLKFTFSPVKYSNPPLFVISSYSTNIDNDITSKLQLWPQFFPAGTLLYWQSTSAPPWPIALCPSSLELQDPNFNEVEIKQEPWATKLVTLNWQ